MTKIKDEKTARELFGKMSSFGIVQGVAKEEKGLSRGALIESVESEETRTLLQERKTAQERGKRGRPKSEDSELWQKMTFQVSKAQLAKLKEIAYQDRLLVKDVLFEALERYFVEYESKDFEHVKTKYY